MERDPLTDSMHVNYDTLNGNCPEYDEVMALFDDSTREFTSDSFNTKWREIGANSEKTSRRRRNRDEDEQAKKLERDLMENLESDTAPEQSDTQVYEWDEYNVSLF
ncbi:unnamed protein product [Nippostrongylus brasiliensis]|uniref:Transposase n=1 Tax=Nippostrongylus brasiliensis TaxID=27835 RepID=A0A0N4YU37_NIPBR|nr:unnamed protein product [Nippostrongylus brasiliensis]